MKVLLATDGSACATQAIERALAMLAPESLEVVVASIAPLPSRFVDAPGMTMGGSTGICYEELEQYNVQEGNAVLQRTRALLGGAAARASYVERLGDPAEQLLAIAHEQLPDLIVMGSHGRGKLGRAFLGSVSEAVLHRWAGPVMIFRQEAPALVPSSPAFAVRDAMTSPLFVSYAHVTLRDAAKMMAEADIGALPVLEGDQLVGIITDRDLIVRALATGVDFATATIGAYCTRELVTATPEMPIAEAVRLMASRKVRRLMVLESGRLVGVVSLGDLAECTPHRAERVLVEISKSPRTLAHPPEARGTGAASG